jgi:hypothetical protein
MFFDGMSNTSFIIVSIAVQAVVLYIVWELFKLSFVAAMRDQKDDKKFPEYLRDSKYMAMIIEGMLPLGNQEIVIDTVNENKFEYMWLPPSTDFKGGAQYTYNFWMNKHKVAGVKDKILFMRGINRSDTVLRYGDVIEQHPGYEIVMWKDSPAASSPERREFKSQTVETLVKNPCVRFGEDADELIIEFNTLKNPFNKVVVKNKLLNVIGNDSWSMYTISFEDYISPNGFEYGVLVKLYINAKEVYIHRVKNDALLVNDAPLIILPSKGQSSQLTGSIADLSYLNYSIDGSGLDYLYSKGFNSERFTTPSMRRRQSSKRMYFDMTIYNEVRQIDSLLK